MQSNNNNYIEKCFNNFKNYKQQGIDYNNKKRNAFF